jgi:DNA replication protein DnaC
MERPTEAYGAVLDAVNEWLSAYQPGQTGLLLHGSAGSGKTRMMTACLRGLILKRALSCRYYDARVFLQLLRNTYNAQSDTTEGELVESFVQPHVVALDELVVPRTDWERETMLMLVGERYKANRTLLVSRLRAMTEPLLVDGPDFRQKGSAA